MTNTASSHPARRSPSPMLPGVASAIMLAIGLGLFAGYLDIAVLFFKKYFWNSEGYFRNARDFFWTVPLGHALLLVIPGALLGVLHRRWPRVVSVRTLLWVLATLAIWSALLRMPLYARSSLVLAAGLGRLFAQVVVAREWRPRQTRLIFAGLAGILVVLFGLSSGWQAVREYRTVAGLPAHPAKGRNVILIVWDTVRAYNLTLYGYNRATTPELIQAARTGVSFKLPIAPAPWTFPSHSSFFTGRWPFRLDTQWKFTLGTSEPTLAEFLTAHGYQTAGFVANTNCCTYETGLGRGFAHFDDYALTPASLLTRTVAGKWIAEHAFFFNTFYDQKWITLQSRGANAINRDFLHWLGRRRQDRPFFAFLNFFDAHEPYIPPPEFATGFGVTPRTPRDFQFLIDYIGANKDAAADRDLLMARDCYDDCILALDAELGRLLGSLKDQGLLANTDIIITSDHGEAFGTHGFMGHSYSVSLEETFVPLVILSPDAPPGRVVNSPVTLRDLPATVVDLVGLSASSPFPGTSLATLWKQGPGDETHRSSPAFSERVDPIVVEDVSEKNRKVPGIEMSIAGLGHHYIRSGAGLERLFDLTTDPYELRDLMRTTLGAKRVVALRKLLLEVLSDKPGSEQVEKAYLAVYRDWLKELVEGTAPPAIASDRELKTASPLKR